jgi:hypothetical protein
MPNHTSVIWTVGLVVGILAVVVNQTGIFPAPWHRYINLAGGLVAVISAYLKGSPLPGKPWKGVNRRKLVAQP